ncbi:ALDH-like protein [Periconia macrospinosa]|uniref:ALDH-like protein n=1 Tax=Periconia macrospinosa TaxID=97972 RepID=A0A2V1DJ88_9PLEO|nr:ALDH-like protein [Periconia macrospinosa]
MSPRTHFSIARLFQEAGFPPGVVNYVLHRPEDAAIGRHVVQRAGFYLKLVILELGGKNFAIVADDADLNKAADQVLFGAFLNSGQICMSTDMVLVHRLVEQDFRALLLKAGKIQDSDPAMLLEDVAQGMDFWSAESFGPLLGLAVYDDEEDAVQVVNSSLFGLSGAIFSRNHLNALKMATRLHTGAVHVNSATVHDEATLPHGGRKESG